MEDICSRVAVRDACMHSEAGEVVLAVADLKRGGGYVSGPNVNYRFAMEFFGKVCM